MNVTRRNLLAAGAGMAACFADAHADAAEAARQLNAFLESLFYERLAQSPEQVTSLGLDSGRFAWAKSRLDDQSAAHFERMTERRRDWLARLRNVERTALNGVAATSYDCVEYELERDIAAARFSFGRPGFPQPYVLSQLGGVYQSVPDFLDSQHSVETSDGAETYLDRLNCFADALNHETSRAARDAASGVTPPDFVIDKTLVQLEALRSTPIEHSTLVQSLVSRTQEREIRGNWRARAERIVTRSIWPALDRQVALLRQWQRRATHDAGIWRVPEGEAYYQFAARYQTTTSMTPDEIHALGVDLVESISAQADTLFAARGMNQGTVGERFAALYADPQFIFDNTDAGKAELLSYLERIAAEMEARLPNWFGTLPRTPLEIRRVPAEIEAGSPAGYYQDGSLDGSRPGAFYINLRDTAELPRWTLPALTYHEGTPGHHLQGALTLEADGLSMVRRILWFTAYGEGWALYSEQLADEMGLFDADPFARLGYLQNSLFRAVRLVLDTGLHAKQWSREQAIQYFVEKMGAPERTAITEVDRYCVWPGQASSYMVGKVMWLRLRELAQSRLGPRFDIRTFHDVGLLTGPMPLDVLQRHYGDWISAV